MLILHVFHKYSDRIHMANIAQMVNVLQSMVLTEGDKMILTPTYYLFKMMKGHMDGDKLDIDYDTKEYEIDGAKVPKISMSASEKGGKITISACNTSVDENETIELEIRDADMKTAVGEVLTGEINAHNTFENPDAITPNALDVKLAQNKLTFTLPAKSIAVITLS